MSTSQLRPPPMPKTALPTTSLVTAIKPPTNPTSRAKLGKPQPTGTMVIAKTVVDEKTAVSDSTATLTKTGLTGKTFLPENTPVSGKTFITGKNPVTNYTPLTGNSPSVPDAEQNGTKAPGWLKFVAPVWGGAVAALQAFAITFAMLTAVVLVALLAGAEPSSFGLALAGSTRFWLLAHGAQISFGELSLHMLPLGFTALCVQALRLTAKRVPPSITAIIAGSLAYAAATFIASRIIGEHAQVNIQAAIGALLVGAAAFSSRMVPCFKKFHGLVNRCPAEIYLGLKAGALLIVATIGVAGFMAAIWAVMGVENSRAAAQTLQPGVVGSVIVGLAQLALLPNWLLWVSGWLVGAGFSMGIGSIYSPAQWHGGPLPALPIVSALPPQSWAGPYWAWVPVLVLLIGALAGWYLWRTLNNPHVFGANVGLAARWPVLLRAGGTAVGSSMLAMLTLQWLARGSLGSGRLSEVGANPWLVALIFGGEVAAGVAMVFIGLQVGKR